MISTAMLSPLKVIQKSIEVHDLCSIVSYYYETNATEYVPIILQIKKNLRTVIAIFLKDIETTLEQKSRTYVERIKNASSITPYEALSFKEISLLNDTEAECKILLASEISPPQIFIMYDTIQQLKEICSYYLASKNTVIDSLLINKTETDTIIFILNEFTEV